MHTKICVILIESLCSHWIVHTNRSQLNAILINRKNCMQFIPANSSKRCFQFVRIHRNLSMHLAFQLNKQFALSLGYCSLLHIFLIPARENNSSYTRCILNNKIFYKWSVKFALHRDCMFRWKTDNLIIRIMRYKFRFRRIKDIPVTFPNIAILCVTLYSKTNETVEIARHWRDTDIVEVRGLQRN